MKSDEGGQKKGDTAEMKVVVIGGVAGGATAAARIRRLDAQAEIVMFERGEYASYSNCCLPYFIGGEIDSSDRLVMTTVGAFKKKYDIEVRVRSEVTDILREEKCVRVLSKETGETYTEPYDKLILAPGAVPVLPKSIQGIDKKHVFSVRDVGDVREIDAFISETAAKKAVVAGGGFIGLEVCENLKKRGLEVTLVEGMDQVMAPFDHDIVQILHKELMDNGIRLRLSSMLVSIGDSSVTVKKGEETFEEPADLVVMAVGIRPETSLAEACGLKIGETGGIRTDRFGRTSDPDIYAVGDAAESYDMLRRKPGRLALAGPAQRQARIAADHIYGASGAGRGFIGSSCLRVFSQNAACTGLNEKALQQEGIRYDAAYVLPFDKVSIMPGRNYMAFKLLFEVPSGKILGAQAVGKGNVDKRIDVIAAMITMGADLEDLKELELCYSPVFGTARDIVNQAAMVGLNILNGRVRQVRVSEARALVESGAYILDVREVPEFERGHLRGAVNIPQSELLSRIDEIPRDVPVYLHCRTSQRSYNVICALQGRGYRNLYNISGSFLGISLYEYFEDRDTGREPIVTAYNFN